MLKRNIEKRGISVSVPKYGTGCDIPGIEGINSKINKFIVELDFL